MRELFVRSISGLVYVIIILLPLSISKEGFVLLMGLLGCLTLFEFLKLIKIKNYLPYVILIAGLYVFNLLSSNEYVLRLLLILSCFVNLILLRDVFVTNKEALIYSRKYLVSIFYIIGGFIFLTQIPSIDNVYTPWILVGVFALIWANDSCAYLVGKNFGKTKLIERISPNKTIEGFVGGLLGSILASFIIFKLTNLLTLNMWITLAIIATVFGTIGDLVQSKFKRSAGVKDSGTIMPGHGGIYDRLDSILYLSPFAFAYLEFIRYVS